MALKSVESQNVEFKSNWRDEYLKVITNKEYQVVCKVSRQTAARELLHMTRSNIFIRHGKTGRDMYYTLTGKATGNINASQTTQVSTAPKGRKGW